MSILLIYRIKLINTAKSYISIVLLLFNISCDISDDESTGMGIPSKSTPFICEDSNNFIRMGNTSNFNSFLIGDSQNSFYSISLENHIYKFDVNSQKVMSDRSLPLHVSIRNFRTSPRDNQSNWFITYAGDGSMTANILDTAATIIASTGINIIKNDFNGFEIDTTPDNGFVVAANAGTYENTDRYHVYRYSDKATQLWQKELINFGIIRTVVSLKEGGFLIGGSKFTREDFTRSSYLTKLDDEGNVLWTKIKHIGHLNNEYFINEIVEDTSGDYFLLLENRGSFALIRSDSAYNIKWSTTIETNFSIFPPTMKNVETDMLVYYSAGFGTHGSHDVHFVSVNETGNVNWHRTFGGTGDEEVYTLRYLESSGYYLIGSTRNWDGKNPDSKTQSYVIKTDLEGNSCR